MKQLLLVATLLLVSLPASAGDEVDYDAPYLVVVDGKLVTRYPAKPHAQEEEQASSSSGVSLPAAIGALLVAALLAALFLPRLIRRADDGGAGRPPTAQ